MITIGHIKSLMKFGDVAGAEALCRKVLKEAPDDAAVKMLYATCRQLLGDEESFRRIMLEIAPQMEILVKADPDCDAAKLWRKSGAVLMEYVVLAVLIVAAIVGGVMIFGKPIQHRYLYGPAPDMVRTLYGPSIEFDRELELQLQTTNAVESQMAVSMATANTVGGVSSEGNGASPEEESRP